MKTLFLVFLIMTSNTSYSNNEDELNKYCIENNFEKLRCEEFKKVILSNKKGPTEIDVIKNSYDVCDLNPDDPVCKKKEKKSKQ